MLKECRKVNWNSLPREDDSLLLIAKFSFTFYYLLDRLQLETQAPSQTLKLTVSCFHSMPFCFQLDFWILWFKKKSKQKESLLFKRAQKPGTPQLKFVFSCLHASNKCPKLNSTLIPFQVLHIKTLERASSPPNYKSKSTENSHFTFGWGSNYNTNHPWTPFFPSNKYQREKQVFQQIRQTNLGAQSWLINTTA